MKTEYTQHMSINIAGLIRNTGKKSMKGFFSNEDGSDCTNKEAREYLAECQAKGWKILPLGECDGFDHFGGGCPKHDVKIIEE